MKNVLVINAGSSSLKYQLINMDDESVIAKGLVERIGMEGSKITYKPTGKDPVKKEVEMNDHVAAMEQVIASLTDAQSGVVSDLSDIQAVGHRVVHGGEAFSGSVLIDDSVMEAIKENIELAPLHNPANIMGIDACKKLMPEAPMVAVFDTAFHAKMPKHSFLYGVNYDAYEQYKVRRYGFHGTSHKYVSERAAELLGKDLKDLKIITCHLGNGSSIAAVDGGISVDTSMGFTPLEGLVMGTRAGDMDTAILPYLMNKMNLSVDDAISYLNKQCGVYGLSGVSSDFRDLWAAADEGNALWHCGLILMHVIKTLPHTGKRFSYATAEMSATAAANPPPRQEIPPARRAGSGPPEGHWPSDAPAAPGGAEDPGAGRRCPARR